jgi:molecular chaperone GrpE
MKNPFTTFINKTKKMSEPKNEQAGAGEEVETTNDQPTNAHIDTPEKMDAQLAEETNELSELDQLKLEKAEIHDKYIRLYSEFDNFRKRTIKERIDLLQTANQEMMVAILPVLDDFERAAKSMESATEIGALKEGVDLIYQKAKNILSQKGLKPMESLGTPFNADLHEAITNIPAPDESQKDMVLDEVERGYMLGEKVIRFAKVIVGS